LFWIEDGIQEQTMSKRCINDRPLNCSFQSENYFVV